MRNKVGITTNFWISASTPVLSRAHKTPAEDLELISRAHKTPAEELKSKLRKILNLKRKNSENSVNCGN